MKSQLKYLTGFVGIMKEQMNLFHNVNADMMKKYEGRRIRVTDKLGNTYQGYFKGFCVIMDVNIKKPMPVIYVCVQNIKKDGTPANRIRTVNCEDALIRLMGKSPANKKGRI